MNYRDIITIEAGNRGGKPCICGMRMTVFDVLEYMASRMTVTEILADFPYLTEDDIRACLSYAADREKSQLVVMTGRDSLGADGFRTSSDQPTQSASSPPAATNSSAPRFGRSAFRCRAV